MGKVSTPVPTSEKIKDKTSAVKSFFDGKKTYIGIALGTAYSLAIHFGWLENSELIWTVIATVTGISYRLAISKSQ